MTIGPGCVEVRSVVIVSSSVCFIAAQSANCVLDFELALVELVLGDLDFLLLCSSLSAASECYICMHC